MKRNQEQVLQQLARAKLGEYSHVRMFRNNVGVAYRKGSDVPIRFGLCEGSSDLIGIRTVAITEDMVGDTIGQFVAAEVKAPRGWITKPQRTFGETIKSLGGLFVIVRSLDDLEEIVK